MAMVNLMGSLYWLVAMWIIRGGDFVYPFLYFPHDVLYDLGFTTLLIGISQPSSAFSFDIHQYQHPGKSKLPNPALISLIITYYDFILHQGDKSENK